MDLFIPLSNKLKVLAVRNTAFVSELTLCFVFQREKYENHNLIETMQRFWLIPSFWCLILLSSIYLTRSKYSKKHLRKFSKRTKYQVCRREYSDHEKLIVEDLLKRRKKGLSEYISSNQQKCVSSKSKYDFDRVLDFGIGLMLSRPHIQFKDTCTIFLSFPLGQEM